MEKVSRYTNSLIAFKSVLIVILVLLYFLSLKNNAQAQGQSLSIYPPVIEVDTTPPSSPVVPIVIQNNNSEDIDLSIQLIPFKQRGATGDVLLDPTLLNSGFYSYYKDRIQFLVDNKKTNTVRLEALETKEITLNINLQKGDPPGDYYYSIVFLSDGSQPKETSLSRIPAGIATNLLLSIGPKEKALGGISEFSTSAFKSSGPVEFNLKIHNGSKHLIQPQGVVEIENLFGQKLAKIEILPQYILSNSDRYLIDAKSASAEASLSYNTSENMPKVAWKEHFLLGIYKATAIIQLEENGSKLDAVTYFIAFPTYFFIALAVVLFVIISIYLRVRKKI